VAGPWTSPQHFQPLLELDVGVCRAGTSAPCSSFSLLLLSSCGAPAAAALGKALLQERTKVRALSDELEHPLNVHR
jgi:hypothetical protein